MSEPAPKRHKVIFTVSPTYCPKEKTSLRIERDECILWSEIGVNSRHAFSRSNGQSGTDRILGMSWGWPAGKMFLKSKMLIPFLNRNRGVSELTVEIGVDILRLENFRKVILWKMQNAAAEFWGYSVQEFAFHTLTEIISPVKKNGGIPRFG